MACIDRISILFFFLIFAAIFPTFQANGGIAELDEFLEKRYKAAFKNSFMAYNPNPEQLTESFSTQVNQAIKNAHLPSKSKGKEGNSTRRGLSVSEQCEALNPIDQCWRCREDWADNRKLLAECARGFGHSTTGGKDGEFYEVTDPSDDDVVDPKPGTLRYAVIQERPLWITFSKPMIIKLKQELIMTSDKTIDGRGTRVHIAYGAGITLQFISNVIIHGIRIHNIVQKSGGMIRDSTEHVGLRTMSDGDAISIFGASHIWIDHVSMAECKDGLIDAIMASTAITVSNCKFNNHDDVMLLGANDGFGEDAIMQVTVAFNRFGKGLVQRMPRCRWGFFHVVNNDYNRWEMYAIGGSSHPTIISMGNRFKASDNIFTKQVTKRDYASPSTWMNWQWQSIGDKFQNGAYFVQSGPSFANKSPLTDHTDLTVSKAEHVSKLTKGAGSLLCIKGRPC